MYGFFKKENNLLSNSFKLTHKCTIRKNRITKSLKTAIVALTVKISLRVIQQVPI